MTEPLRKPDSPCRGFCTTALGDDACRSCGRTFEEVCDWIRYSEAEKEACWKRLQEAGRIDAERKPLNQFARESPLFRAGMDSAA